jgi:hypothetical protein
MKHPALLACLGIIAAVAVVASVPFELIVQLTVGWVLFLFRVVPRVRVDAAGVVTAVVCVAALVIGLQTFAGWVTAHNRPAPEARWRWRWTLALVGVVVLAFAAGVAAVGIVHQTGWLLNSPVPLFESRAGRREVADQWVTSQLRVMGVASLSFQENTHAYPPGTTFDSQGRMLHSWQTRLLPFMEQDNVYRTIHHELPWDHPANLQPFRAPIESYIHPVPGWQKDEEGRCLTGYAGNVRLLCSDVPIDFRRLREGDGTASLILAAEAPGNYRPWGDPRNLRDPARGLNRSADGFGSPLGGSTLILFADGSVRSFKDDADPEFLKALATPAPRGRP